MSIHDDNVVAAKKAIKAVAEDRTATDFEKSRGLMEIVGLACEELDGFDKNGECLVSRAVQDWMRSEIED